MATHPPEFKDRLPYSKGDLIEVLRSANTSYCIDNVAMGPRTKIAIIQRINDSNFGGKMAIVGVSREDGHRWLNASSVRFHSPAFTTIDGEGDIPHLSALIEEFEADVSEKFVPILEKVKEIVKRHTKYQYLNRIIYYDDLVEETFGKGKAITAVESYVIYKAMRHCRLVRDCLSKSVSAFRPLPKDVSDAYNLIIRNRRTIGSLKKKIYAAAFSLSDCRILEDEVEKAAVVLFEHCAALPDWFHTHESIINTVKAILDGVWPFNKQSDLIMLLKRIKNEYPGNVNMPLRQSVVGERTEEDQGYSIIEVKDQELVVQACEIIAIDSEATSEVDDALGLTESPDGTFWLNIYVADPSRFIQPHSQIDQLAYSRTSTVYLPELSLPMLPASIISQVSLSPQKSLNQTVVFSVQLAPNGDIADYQFINCNALKLTRCSYEQCDAILADSKHPLNKSLSKMLSMARAHLAFRKNSGLVGLYLPRPRVTVAADSSISVSLSNLDNPSNLLVSEAMVMAGRVAGFLGKNFSIPLPYRYHLPQDQENCRIESIEQRLRFLDSLRPAAIDTRPQYHWAMGLFGYVKSTSPLRRYLNLLTHQQLKAVVLHGKPAPYSEEVLRKMLPRLYSSELYIKRLQQASIKYWLLTHLQALLQKNGPIECDAVHTKDGNYFLEMYNTTFYIRTVSHQEEYTRVRLRLQSADPIKMYIDAQVIK